MKGLLLGDRYRILQALGMGGMGRTYLAEDTQRPGRPKCVVKHLRPASTDVYFLATARRLFNAEAEVLENLGQHDRMPKLLAYFEQGEEFYLVQELIDGYPLTAELGNGQRWTEPEVIQLLQEVLELLEVVHSYNMIHRDIKPDNLLRRKDGRLVLIDFGAVKQVRMQPTAFGNPTVVVGTPGYMPPEQINGRPHPSSDLYALGIIAIQALTGIAPTQIMRDPQGELVWRYLVEVHPGLAFFLSKMVRRQVGDRFQSAKEAVQALQPIRSEIGESIPTSTPSQPSQIDLALSALSLQNLQPPALASESSPPLSSRIANFRAMAARIRIPSVRLCSARSGLIILVGGTLAGMLAGVMTVVAADWKAEQAQQEKLAEITSLRDQNQVAQCIELAGSVSPEASIYGEARAIMYQCQAAQYQQDLAAAKQLAEAGQFRQALEKATSIAATSSAYREAQQLVSQWSDRVVNIAAEYYQKGDVDGAVAALREIPTASPVYAYTQKTAAQWRNEWQDNQTLLEAAQQAIDTGNWQQAIEIVQQTTLFGEPIAQDSPYWQQKIQPILSHAQGEMARLEQEQRAQQVATAQQQQQALVLQGKLDRRSPGVQISSEGKLYRDYAFEGKQGELLSISMQSDEFDTQLALIDPQGKIVATTDENTPFNLNSAISRFTLPANGTYRVRAMSEHPPLQGEFTLTVQRVQ